VAAIRFEHVSKRFVIHREQRNTLQERLTGFLRSQSASEEFWALRDVSFSVEPGESIGLIGHNGAGKSTALKLLTRILEPTSGTVEMQGRVSALLELGSGFHPDLSGRENVFLYGSLMGIGRRAMEERLDEIVEFADIGNFLDMEIKHYSSGMYTRLAFAVATAVDPDILITDEILAVGDEAFQRKCMDRIYSFRRAGKTIVFVSHALETVRSLCDIAVWLDHGESRAIGPVGDVIDAYLAEVNRQERRRLAQNRTEDEDPAETADGDLRRHGSREIAITRVELFDADGVAGEVFYTGEPVTIRMHYQAKRPVDDPVFGIGLHHENGLWLAGPNTDVDRFSLPCVEGSGSIDYTIRALPLLSGRYLLSVAVVDSSQLHTFDHHDRSYGLVVQNRIGRERYGIIPLPGEWHWRPQ
jgi:lipopolysaccharide transport system ATP-binding protein